MRGGGDVTEEPTEGKLQREETPARARVSAALGAALCMLAIFAASSVPGSSVPDPLGRFSTLGHFGMYALLGALYLLALPRRPAWKSAVLAVLLASAYGLSDEFHQSFVPGRTPDVFDWLVDTVAAATAAFAIVTWRRRR